MTSVHRAGQGPPQRSWLIKSLTKLKSLARAATFVGIAITSLGSDQNSETEGYVRRSSRPNTPRSLEASRHSNTLENKFRNYFETNLYTQLYERVDGFRNIASGSRLDFEVGDPFELCRKTSSLSTGTNKNPLLQTSYILAFLACNNTLVLSNINESYIAEIIELINKELPIVVQVDKSTDDTYKVIFAPYTDFVLGKGQLHFAGQSLPEKYRDILEQTPRQITESNKQNYSQAAHGPTRYLLEVSRYFPSKEDFAKTIAFAIATEPVYRSRATWRTIEQAISNPDNDGYFDLDTMILAASIRSDKGKLKGGLKDKVTDDKGNVTADSLFRFLASKSHGDSKTRLNPHFALPERSEDPIVVHHLPQAQFFSATFDPLDSQTASVRLRNWAIERGYCEKKTDALVFVDKITLKTFLESWQEYFNVFTSPAWLDKDHQAYMSFDYSGSFEQNKGLAKINKDITFSPGTPIKTESILLDCKGYAAVANTMAQEFGANPINLYAILTDGNKLIGHAISSFTLKTEKGDTFIIIDNGKVFLDPQPSTSSEGREQEVKKHIETEYHGLELLVLTSDPKFFIGTMKGLKEIDPSAIQKFKATTGSLPSIP